MCSLLMVTQDIISLKTKTRLVEEDATTERQHEWYSFLLSNDMVETVYDNNHNLLGFLEYVYLDKIPQSWEDVQLFASDFVSGKILFVCNTIADCPHTLWKMKAELFRKNKGMDCLVWHNRKKDQFIVLKNIRKGEVISEKSLSQ